MLTRKETRLMPLNGRSVGVIATFVLAALTLVSLAQDHPTKQPEIVSPDELKRLKQEAALPDKSLWTPAAKAQVRLARLGDRSEMESIVCEMQFGTSAKVQYEAISKLQAVGGYASIQALSAVMLANPDYNARPSGFVARQREYAIKALGELLPQVIPARFRIFPPTATEEQIHGWFNWIQEHREELYRPPTEGWQVDKKGCRRYLRKDSPKKKPTTPGESSSLLESRMQSATP